MAVVPIRRGEPPAKEGEWCQAATTWRSHVTRPPVPLGKGELGSILSFRMRREGPG